MKPLYPSIVTELPVYPTRNDPDYAGGISVAGDMSFEAYEAHDAETFDAVTDLYWPFTAFGIKASYPSFDVKRMLTPPVLARFQAVTTQGWSQSRGRSLMCVPRLAA